MLCFFLFTSSANDIGRFISQIPDTNKMISGQQVPSNSLSVGVSVYSE